MVSQDLKTQKTHLSEDDSAWRSAQHDTGNMATDRDFRPSPTGVPLGSSFGSLQGYRVNPGFFVSGRLRSCRRGVEAGVVTVHTG